MATGSCQGIMKSIATTGIWPSCQPSAVVIGGKNGAEALFMRIRPFSFRRMRRRLRGQSFRGRGVRAPFHKQGYQLDGFLAKVASYAMEI